MIALEALNAMSDAAFIAALGTVFERSPWVAERVVGQRPFVSTLHLQRAMCAAVTNAGAAEQLALIRAHPELAGRAAIRGELTAESTREQAGAGLAACSPEEYAKLQALNSAYSQKFGFPFVLAVKGHDRTSIIAALDQRVTNDVATERAVALEQIGRIAGFRLAELIDEPLGAQIMSMCERLAEFSEHEDDLTCSYLSAAHRQTAAQIRDWMLAAGLEVATDAVGNVIGTWRSERAETLVTGSHYDTVINGGKYDGRLGILLPIAVVGRLKRSGVRLPYTFKVVAFAEEEGVRFKSTFLGSRALAGRFDAKLLESVDNDGVTMAAAMIDAGLEPATIPAAALDAKSLLGFVEVHIEQGPVLLSEQRPVGVVTSIAGSARYAVSIVGLAGHAGTVPMTMRRDAAAAAAELILAVEQACGGQAGLVGTVGQLQVPNGAINVIPGRCKLSIDIRAADNATRDAAVAAVLEQGKRTAADREVEIQFREVLRADCVPCAPSLKERWSASITRVTGEREPRHLPSGAGHDAMMMAAVTDVGMLFVRCGNGGISHHPDETMSADDAEVAARVFADFLQHFQ